MDHQVEPGDDLHHTGRSFHGLFLDAVHDQLRNPDGQLALELVRGRALRSCRHRGQSVLGLLGNQGRHVLARQGPVHGRAEIENVGFGAEGLSPNLFGRDVVGGSLDARLDGTDGAALTQVDDLDRSGLADEDIIGLDVAVDVALLVQGVEACGDHAKDQQDVAQAQGCALFEGLAVEVFHGQEQFPDAEHAADFLEFIAFSDVRVVDLLGNVVLVFGLLEDTLILGSFVDQAFEGDDTAVFLIGCQVDRAPGTVADPPDNRESPHTENIFGHGTPT